MEKLFTINPAATIFDLKNAVEEKITKVKSIVNCLMLATAQRDNEIENEFAYHALWVLEDYLDQTDCLLRKINTDHAEKQ